MWDAKRRHVCSQRSLVEIRNARLLLLAPHDLRERQKVYLIPKRR
jgi:hypothetical protein